MARHVDRRLWGPPQLTMSLLGIAGFWVAELRPGMSVETPHIAIGVHPDGDWHAAVDYYVEKHRQQAWQFPLQPDWFAEQAAIYTHSGDGAGGMYLSNTIENLTDGAIGTYFEAGDTWPEWGPIPISHAGLAPAGAPLAVVMRREKTRTCSSSTTGVRSGGHRCATARGVRPSR